MITLGFVVAVGLPVAVIIGVVLWPQRIPPGAPCQAPADRLLRDDDRAGLGAYGAGEGIDEVLGGAGVEGTAAGGFGGGRACREEEAGGGGEGGDADAQCASQEGHGRIVGLGR